MSFGHATPAMISTWYGDIESLLMDKFAQIKLVILMWMACFQTAVSI